MTLPSPKWPARRNRARAWAVNARGIAVPETLDPRVSLVRIQTEDARIAHCIREKFRTRRRYASGDFGRIRDAWHDHEAIRHQIAILRAIRWVAAVVR